MKKPFSAGYDWDDFDNTRNLTDFQKYRIKRRYKKEVKGVIQDIINESIQDRKSRRSELNAHSDPNDPYKLDLGGEG